MNDPVNCLSGIGKEKTKQLNAYNINTVGDLINAKPIPITGFSSMVTKAKQHVESKQKISNVFQTKSKDEEKEIQITGSFVNKLKIENNENQSKYDNKKENRIESGNVGIEIRNDNGIRNGVENGIRNINGDGIEIEKKENKEEEKFKYITEHHSWFELQIELPRISKSGKFEFKNAIIHELCINPKVNRVSFVCSWISVKENKRQEKICSKSYSPQFIFHINPNLPTLTINISKEELKELPFKSLLTNVLDEIELMKLSYEFDKAQTMTNY